MFLMSIEDRNICEQNISTAECLSYLKSMKNETSPGLDGFTVEFFKFFWKDLGVYLVRSLHHAIESGQLSVTQTKGIITLLPKEEKDKLYLKNWRPISLLNVDYKIFSGALSIRMKNTLNKVICETQKGFLPGRDISECTRFIYDVLEETKAKQIPGILLKIDFEKAFDSLSHDFMHHALEHFGFGPNFKRFITLLYKDAQSCVLYNGHMSPFLK